MPCYKKHRDEQCLQHNEPHKDPQTTSQSDPRVNIQAVDTEQRAGEVNLSEVQHLLTKFPDLRSELYQIYMSTKPTDRQPQNAKAFDQALRLLNKAQAKGIPGIEAFIQLTANAQSKDKQSNP